MNSIALALLLGLLALVLRSIFPERFLHLTRVLVDEPAACLLVGGGAALAAGAASLGLVVTVVGIPLAAFLAGAATLGSYLGLAAAATVIGAALPFERLDGTPHVRLFAGAAALLLASWVPVLGGLVVLGTALWGLGGVVRTRFAPAPEDELVGEGPYRTADAL